MKSSEPLFTRQNPFHPASTGGTAHYHPSRKHSLSKKEKKTTLSPVRSNQRSSPHLTTLSPESHQSPEKRNSCFGVTDEQPVFAESWPTTESGSSPTSSEVSSDMETATHTVRARNSAISSKLGVRPDSVPAEYVERFHRGPPQSREERQQTDPADEEKRLPFWWTSPLSLPHSSTPTKTTDKDVRQPLKDDHGPSTFSPAGPHQHNRSMSPCRASLSILSEGEFDDTEILHLQERANRLLLRDECTLSDGSIHVSSEGLECSDFSSPVSTDELMQRPLIPSIVKCTTVKANSGSVQALASKKSFVTPSLVTPTRPEEDILFQWRLRRKIEQARECPQPRQHPRPHGPAFRWEVPSFSLPSASGQAYKQSPQPLEFSQTATHPAAPQLETMEAHAPCPPTSGPHTVPALVVSGSSVPQPQAIARVPAHMHLLCDVLPCPIQSSHVSRPQNISQNITTSHSKVSHKKTQVPRNSINTFPDEPVREHIPSSPPASWEATEREEASHLKRSERNKNEKACANISERTTVTSTKKRNKSRHAVNREHGNVTGPTNRSTARQKIPQNIVPWTEQRQQKGRQEMSSSPIHSALGQVVSEVLFSVVDSSPAQQAPVLSGPSPCTSSALSQASVPPCDAQNSKEVISQLLQEAEDSDEKEFEDDHLLQVLRKQRTWVKEQISQVDSMLNDLVDEQQLTYT